MTIIIVTHDIADIGKYASKLLYLDKKVVFYGSFEDFCSSPDMASYFGEFAQHLICHRHDIKVWSVASLKFIVLMRTAKPETDKLETLCR